MGGWDRTLGIENSDPLPSLQKGDGLFIVGASERNKNLAGTPISIPAMNY
jgi:hypothetical protein